MWCLRAQIDRGRYKEDKEWVRGTSLVTQSLRLCLPMEQVQALSLVREVRSHMPRGQKTKTYNRNSIVTNSIKIFYIVHIKKKRKKKRMVIQPSESRNGNIHSCGQRAGFQSFTRSRTVMRDSNAWQKNGMNILQGEIKPFSQVHTQNPHSPMRTCLCQGSSNQPY